MILEKEIPLPPPSTNAETPEDRTVRVSAREPGPAEPPVHEPEPDPGQPPVVDPTPGLEPDPEPNPNPYPDDPDPEPDRDPHPPPPSGPDPDPDELPRTDPPAEPVSPPMQMQAGAVASEAPTLVLTSKPVPQEKPSAKAAKPKKAEPEADGSPFSVFVGQVYDGPLDLLLDLIRKQDIDIYDIPIARITAQFLGYVNQLKATDVDVAGEFIYTASLLIHIKSKMLLPRAPSGPDDVAEDPRRELVERLLEHERFKNAAQMLQQKQMLEAATWTNPGLREFKEDAAAGAGDRRRHRRPGAHLPRHSGRA